jgi:hypothetical protein
MLPSLVLILVLISRLYLIFPRQWHRLKDVNAIIQLHSFRLTFVLRLDSLWATVGRQKLPSTRLKVWNWIIRYNYKHWFPTLFFLPFTAVSPNVEIQQSLARLLGQSTLWLMFRPRNDTTMYSCFCCTWNVRNGVWMICVSKVNFSQQRGFCGAIVSKYFLL